MMSSWKETPVDVVGGCEFGIYPKINKSELWNLYISDDWLVSFSGYKRFLEITNKKVIGRGSFVSERNNIIVVVLSDTVYYIDSSFTVNYLGKISTAVGPVYMDENLANQIAIVDGLNIYIYNVSIRSLTKQPLDNQQLIPNYVCYHNTFFLIGNGVRTGNGSKWFAYSYETPTTITETTEFALQTKPDHALAIVRIPGSSSNVMVFGRTVTEIWTNVGGLYNYAKNQSLNVDFGCVNVATIATSDRFIMWLAINSNSTPVLMLFGGNENVAISTDGIDSLLSRVKNPQNSFAYFYKTNGHLFYIITFYSSDDNFTLCYDVETKKFSLITDAFLNYFPPRNILYYLGKTYFLSTKKGSLYEINQQITTYDEGIGLVKDETVIPRVRVTSNLRLKSSSRFRSRNFTIIMDQGNDKEFTQLGENYSYIPKTELYWSIDGGYTFSKPQEQNMHFLGKRQNIFNWTGPFGLNNEICFKMRFITKSYVCVQNGTLEVMQ